MRACVVGALARVQSCTYLYCSVIERIVIVKLFQEREAAEAKFGGSENVAQVPEANGHVEADEDGAQQDQQDTGIIDSTTEQPEPGKLCSFL